MRIKNIRVGQLFCFVCVGYISGRVLTNLALSWPASHANAKGTCAGCGDTLDVRKAGKIIKKEEPK